MYSTVYCSYEKYSKATNELLLRRRAMLNTPRDVKAITIPSDVSDDVDSYLMLKVYERSDYRNLMSMSLVDGITFHLSSFQ